MPPRMACRRCMSAVVWPKYSVEASRPHSQTTSSCSSCVKTPSATAACTTGTNSFYGWRSRKSACSSSHKFKKETSDGLMNESMAIPSISPRSEFTDFSSCAREVNLAYSWWSRCMWSPDMRATCSQSTLARQHSGSSFNTTPTTAREPAWSLTFQRGGRAKRSTDRSSKGDKPFGSLWVCPLWFKTDS
jgi:hypothetical protein